MGRQSGIASDSKPERLESSRLYVISGVSWTPAGINTTILFALPRPDY